MKDAPHTRARGRVCVQVYIRVGAKLRIRNRSWLEILSARNVPNMILGGGAVFAPSHF